jgi:putative phosphoesterase
MKVLIVSDSHGLTKELEKLIEKHHGEVETFIHCGDSELDPNDPAINHFTVVRGNCDFDERFPEDVIKKIGDQTIFITHGHRYSVKSSLMGLSYKAREVKADIACFGHSHQLGAEMVHGTLFINPGSIRLPRGRDERTYVILELLGEGYQLKVYDIEQGELSHLSQVFSLSD